MAKDWSAEETARIISEVKNPTCSNQELAKQLGRSAQSVAAKKRHLAGLAAEDQPAAEKKPGEKHTRGRRGRKSAQKVRQEAVTEVQETAAAAEAPAAAEEPAEKKSGEQHSRGRRGRKSAQKAQQEPVPEAQETAASAEAPAAAEEPAEKKSGERHSRSRRGRKSAQKAQQEPQQAPAPQESTPEGKTQDAERAALAELERSFVIRQTAPAAETPAEPAAEPKSEEQRSGERRGRGRRDRKPQNRQPVQEPAAEIEEIAAEPQEIAEAEDTVQELPAVRIWTREEDAMLLIAPLRSEDDLAAELHCTREEIHARREQLKKQRMEEKERRQRDYRSRRAEAQKRRRVPLERCTTELRTETEAAEEWAEAVEAENAFLAEPEDADKRISAIRAAVSMLRSSSEAAAVSAVRDFLAVTDFILGSGI
ncbi:MAG: hypothetical protein K6E36_00640 [Oscillospiraceae bacterium]|nr:hypothetical protein [Oscillospiraceae bacterium]